MKSKIKEKIKAKVQPKIAKAKAKITKKCGALLAVLFSLAIFAGCQNPAQRAQTAETYVYIYEGANATFGAEFVSLAQSNETAGNDAGMTASPTTTTDIRPTTDVNTTGAKTAGVLESIVGAFSQWLTTDEGKAAAASASANCPDGSCSDCSDGSCSPPSP